MKQKASPIIRLIDLLESGEDSAFGNTDGRLVFQKLAAEVDKYPESRIIGISLEGIKRTDASFPRESVISFAKVKCQEKGFYLFDFRNQDLMDNWDYAAKAKNFNIMILVDGGYTLIGPEINPSAKELLDYVFLVGEVTTSRVADRLKISPQNASGRLKKLYNHGLILGLKESATSGGMEYVFKAIK